MWKDPFDEIKRFEKRMRRLFDEFWSEHPLAEREGKLVPSEGSLEPFGGRLEPFREPYSDVIESDKEVIVTMELPGVEKSDIKITTTDNSVEISAERRSAAEEKREERGYIMRERSYSSFYRKIPLSASVDPSRAKASYKNGILEIVLPKTGEPKKTIKVE